MTQRSKITQLPSTASTKKKKYEKKKRKEKKKDEKKKGKYTKKQTIKKLTIQKEKERNKQLIWRKKKNNGGPLLCHTIKAISRRIFSNKEQCQLLIKDYNCFKTASTD